MEKTYNGWTNYETWLVKLWLDNEEGTCRYCEELARKAKDTYALSQSLKDMIEECSPDLGLGMYSDLLNAAISGVNWYEIAEHYMEERET